MAESLRNTDKIESGEEEGGLGEESSGLGFRCKLAVGSISPGTSKT